MTGRLLPLLLLAGATAFGKPWQGLDPGTSTKADVIKKFGEPTKASTTGSREVLAYMRLQAIKGTTQAQFKIATATQVLERIDVFPAVELTKAQIEKSYGSECDPKQPAEPCYLKRGEGGKTYFLYAKLGLAVFFKDATVVQSLAFLPAKKE